jgi:arylsulfatase A-like enzyme
MDVFRMIIVSLFMFACGPVKDSINENKPINVLLFLVDDLGWKDVGCYGSNFYETPNIDKLAEDGIRFTNAYAASHVCSPTRASLMTGMYPATLNITNWLPGTRNLPNQRLQEFKINQHLPYDINTLPGMLKENGYKTAIFGKWHIGDDSASTARQGFDLHIPDWDYCCPKESYYFPYKMRGLETGEEGEYLTDRLTDEAMAYMEENKDSPFFLYLSHFAVHDPIEGRPDLVAKYKEKLKSIERPKDPPFILEGKPGIEAPIPREELDRLLDLEMYQEYKVFPNQAVKIKQHQDNIHFAAMVESIDESLGRVINKLEELEIADHTLIIFYSDNGGMSAANFWNPEREISEDELDKAYSTSNLPLRGGKGWLYEGGIRVPLIFKMPGSMARGSLSDVPVISPDIYPTILDLLGFHDKNTEIDGQSFLPILEGEKKLDRKAIFWHFPHYSNHGMQSPGGAIRSGDYKLLEYYETGKVQLFNLKEDIGEQNNLADKEIAKVAELRAMLHQWRDKVGAEMMEENPEYK